MPLFRRYGRPGLLDTVGSTAIVAGTPVTISRALDRTPSSDVGPVGRISIVSSPGDESWAIASQLRILSDLRAAGDISAAEFATAKSRLLNVSPPRPKGVS